MMNGVRLAVIAISMSMLARPAAAQTYTIQSITTGNVGTVAAAASGTTVFQIYKTTSTVSGSGQYITGAMNSPVITINCVDGSGSSNSCANNSARVTLVRTGVNTGRGQTFLDIGVEGVSGSSVSGATYNTGGTMDFVASGWTAAGTRQFLLGMWLPVLGDASSTATTASSQFRVAVAKNPTVPSGGTTATVVATVRRALRISKVGDLRFGTLIAPTSGINYVGLDTAGNRGQADGSGNYGAGTVILVSSVYGPAQLTATGEPGTTFSLSVPSTMTMSGPGAAIAVTLNAQPASGTVTLPAGGTQSLLIAGYLAISAGQAPGSYSGSFTVTIAYN